MRWFYMPGYSKYCLSLEREDKNESNIKKKSKLFTFITIIFSSIDLIKYSFRDKRVKVSNRKNDFKGQNLMFVCKIDLLKADYQ